MPETSKIICAVDFSAASMKTLEYAKDLASIKNACLYILHVFHYDDLAATVYEDDTYYQEAEQKLKALCMEHDPLHRYIQPLLEAGEVSPTIVRCAEEMQPDFMVIGSHGHNIIQELLGSTAAYVMEHSRVPLLIIKH
ncbi:universal stress protein [Mucilaginibacter sp. HC2]|uniref:universal stress protein n=1 Tax=Mucilaginibacter inviolabilis TaxID=2714892 RepID=UPI00140852A4|nr:universal stress protein [Mucilaginibacter inviolabilis]NHA03682.1 universal stress protein [Mucilaginibacter inviolabilis]